MVVTYIYYLLTLLLYLILVSKDDVFIFKNVYLLIK